MRANGYRCYQTKCGACEGNVCKEPFDSALGCDARLAKPETNADRIRAMSDEELAEWLNRLHTLCECCSARERCGVVECDMVCEQNILDWLRQPVKGGGIE